MGAFVGCAAAAGLGAGFAFGCTAAALGFAGACLAAASAAKYANTHTHTHSKKSFVNTTRFLDARAPFSPAPPSRLDPLDPDRRLRREPGPFPLLQQDIVRAGF